MSADNGIYVLETPRQAVVGDELPSREYRVAHAQAIDNITFFKEGPLRDAELVAYFGRAEVLYNKTEALVKAHEEADKCSILEYGVNLIHWPTPFPILTVEEARKILKDYCEKKLEGE